MNAWRSVGASTLLIVGSIGAQPADVSVVHVASGFTSIIGLTNAGDGSGRLFGIQQTGQIRIWDGDDTLQTPFLDIGALTTSTGERGLLGVAFHPDYENNGFFFVNYTDLSGDTVIARYTVSAGDTNQADSASALQILTFGQPASNHNGGDIHFGPDGFLYISSGDGGFDDQNGQDIDSLLGKILRIDVDSDDFPADAGANYGIPPGNPFAGATPGADEIWLMGLRNPWRFSFDRLNGDLFIGDVGDGAWEEIDYLAGGGSGGENFGWPCYEGDVEFNTSGCGPQESYIAPISVLPHDFPPDNNCSVIGGFRYRGEDYPRLQGWYFFTDWCTGTLWAAEPGSGFTWDAYAVAALDTFGTTGFGEGDDGELYLNGWGQILQIIDPFEAIFEDGFESGATSRWSDSIP